jgi:cholesterol transport system auxiliary component
MRRREASARPCGLVSSLILLAIAVSGCAFAAKGEALTPRYFSPPLEFAPDRDAAAVDRIAPPPLELRVGRIEAAAYLEERMAYRVSESELAYYDDRRWTELPERFVRRALDRELFETRTFVRVVSGDAATLDVDVLSFEELRGSAPSARLSLAITLRDDRHALLDRTITMVAPVQLGAQRDPAAALATSMGDLLVRAAKEIAEGVSAELGRQRSSDDAGRCRESTLGARGPQFALEASEALERRFVRRTGSTEAHSQP